MRAVRRYVVAAAVAVSLLGFAVAARAVENTPPVKTNGSVNVSLRGRVELVGVVTGVDVAAKTLRVKVWGAEWTVRLGNVKITPRAGRAGLSAADVSVNHIVHVVGAADAAAPLTVTAKTVVDRSLIVRQSVYRGSVVEITPPDAFTLQRDGGGRLVVRVTATTKVYEGETAKVYSDIVVGTFVQVNGVYDETSNTLVATAVRIRPPQKR